MNRLLKILMIIFFILVILFIVLGIKNANKQPVSDMVVTGTETVDAIAIDLDGQKDLSKENILAGRDGILVLNTNLIDSDAVKRQLVPRLSGWTAVNNEQTTNPIYSFNGLQSLVNFDTQSDGMITAEDLVYPGLEIVMFRNGKIVNHLTLLQAGVRAIIFDQKYLEMERQDNEARFKTIAGTAIMADSSTRVVQIIPLSLGLFNQGS